MAMSAQGPEDHARLAEDFPSPSAALHMDMTAELERQAAAAAVAAAANALEAAQPSPSPAPSSSHQPHEPSSGPSRHARPRALAVNSFYTPTPQNRDNGSDIPQSAQIAILREHFAKNPHPTKKELEQLSTKTGRDWRKIREYFRQRRNQGRGLGELEASAEPSRAKAWLHMSYRPASQDSMIHQYELYTAYKERFSSASRSIPLMSGTDLIPLLVQEIPGSVAAQINDDYVIRGLAKREEGDEDGTHSSQGGVKGEEGPDKKRKREYTKEEKEIRAARRLEQMLEPIRGSMWLLDNYQSADPAESKPQIMQYDLYASYLARFTLNHTPTPTTAPMGTTVPSANTTTTASMTDPEPTQQPKETHIKANTTPHQIPSGPTLEQSNPNRLLTAVQLLDLLQMAFPGASPAKDEEGNFVIKGLMKKPVPER